MGKIIITDMVPLAVRGAWFAYLSMPVSFCPLLPTNDEQMLFGLLLR